MKIGLVAMSGVRVQTEALRSAGVTLPGFIRRGETVASMPSLGLLTLAGMTPACHEVHYFEIDELEEAADLPAFDLVGISSLTARVEDAYILADRYRASGIKVVIGGLHASALPDEAQAHADAVVVGGAEGAWQRVLDDAEQGRLHPRYVGARMGVFDPPLYVRPRFDLLKTSQRGYNRLTVQTSRGCPRACSFCAASLRITDGFNQKPVELVIDEIRAAKAYIDRPFFEFADDNTFLNKVWSKEFLRALAPEQIRYFTETDASVANDPELCDLLANSGCRQVLIGFESPREQDLDGIDPSNWKSLQVPSARKAIDELQSRGIAVIGCFILGLDAHTPDIFPSVLDFVRKSGLADVQYTVQTPFPGTPLYHRLNSEKRLIQKRFWERCTLFDVAYRPKRMSIEELESGMLWLFKETYGSMESMGRRRAFARMAADRKV